MKYLLLLLLAFPALANNPLLSREPFNRGKLIRETGGSRELCREPRETMVFCEEGFFFRDALFMWENLKSAPAPWPLPFPLSGVHAVSIGMALPFRFKEVPESFHSLGVLSAYIFDGWGFMTAILARSSDLPPCPGGILGKYCEYGRGRATFFTGKTPKTDLEKEGKAFAEGMHGIAVPPPYGPITAILRGKASSSLNLKLCLYSQHIVDCALNSF